MVETVNTTRERSGWVIRKTLKHLGLKRSTYYSWMGSGDSKLVTNDRTNSNPYSALPEEVDKVIKYALEHTELRHRELTWRMVDENIAYLSSSTVYRILCNHNLIKRWNRQKRRDKRVRMKPTAPNQRWQSDISYVKIGGKRYYLIIFIDEYSRYIVHWELLTSMDANSVSLAAAAALNGLPDGVRPIIQTDNGSCYISHQFKVVLSENGVGHHLIRPHCPEENGIVERSNRTIQDILDEIEIENIYHGREVIGGIITYYDEVRLHSSLNYLRPADYHFGNPEVLLEKRRLKIQNARHIRKEENIKRRTKTLNLTYGENEVNYKNHNLTKVAKSPI